MRERPTLEEARSRLKALGYLDAGVERLFFRSVFEGKGGAFLPAVLLGGAAAALAAVAAVVAAEPGFGASLPSVAVLFAHIFAADLAPAALLALLLALLADHVRAPGAAATAAGILAAFLIFALWIGGTYSLGRELTWLALFWGLPIGVAALLLATAVRLALLARAYASSGALPRRARRRGLAAAIAAALLVAILLFFSRRGEAAAAPPQPSPRNRPVVVLAVDGLALDSPDKPARVADLLAAGATGWWPAERHSPPEIWTDIATGTSSKRHGVRALARVRPLGSPQALRPLWGAGWYLRGVGPALRLVSSAPVSVTDRRALDFWEVSASAGIPSLAVGWWASGPWPGATVVDNRTVLAQASDGADVDRIALEVFRAEEGRGFGLAALYLPGGDILRNDRAARVEALARVEKAIEEWTRSAARGDLVFLVVAADSHPTEGALGRMVVFDRDTEPRSVRIRPQDVAPSILARAGVPAARDLDGKPVPVLFAPGSLDPATVATYGPRVAPADAAAPVGDREYLEKLRSLGYLQ